MEASLIPWVDGEKIPDQRVRDVFRPHPGVCLDFSRSSLLIGSRGVGKTTLFRYLKETHKGVAVHLSLLTEFGNLTKETNLGPLARDLPKQLEPEIVGKASALLGVSIIERLARKGIAPPCDVLRECLPVRLRVPKQVDYDWCARMKARVASTPSEKFGGLSQSRWLPTLLSGLGSEAERLQGPLLLLLDRADMVPPAFLRPVIELLDQSGQYIALVAMRPGHAARVIAGSELDPVPGDHYDMVYLGVTPYCQEWVDFLLQAVAAQLGQEVVSSAPEDVRTSIVSLSRDSVRTALELFGRVREGTGAYAERLQVALEDLKEKHLVAAQQTLRDYHPDFRKLVNDIRGEVASSSGSIKGPVLLTVEESAKDSLFQTSDRLDQFVEAALRSGALCMPNGQRWSPGSRPRELEIPPLVMWDNGDGPWPSATARYTQVKRPEEKVLKVFRATGPPPSIFIAYRMGFPESVGLRDRLSDAVNSRPKLSGLDVKDGRVPHGVKWPDTIRERIKKSKLVVGDATGLRSDVLFELGFAYGLRKPVIPVVADAGAREGMPRWLTAVQIEEYGTEIGLFGIVSSIATLLFDPEFSKPPRPPDPVPGLAVWLRKLQWNEQACAEFEASASREGLTYQVLNEDTPAETLIRRAASANFLVVSFDGTTSDALCHYICGAVVSRPDAGYGQRQLARKIIMLERPGGSPGSLIADSLLNCQETAKLVGLAKVGEETCTFGRQHRTWSMSPLGKD